MKVSFVAIFCLWLYNVSFSQIQDKLYLTTGMGVNRVTGNLQKAFRSTIAFNSGFEKALDKAWYVLVDLNFNSLRYDQQERDGSSPYFFRNTSSSLFLIGINGGRNFRLGQSPWFSSLYMGTGYLNIGKPRVNLDEINNIVTQSMIRKWGMAGKLGARIAFETSSTLFQTLYFDASLLTSTLRTEGANFKSISFFIGTRMSMSNEGNKLKRSMKAIRRLR